MNADQWYQLALVGVPLIITAIASYFTLRLRTDRDDRRRIEEVARAEAALERSRGEQVAERLARMAAEALRADRFRGRDEFESTLPELAAEAEATMTSVIAKIQEIASEANYLPSRDHRDAIVDLAAAAEESRTVSRLKLGDRSEHTMQLRSISDRGTVLRFPVLIRDVVASYLNREPVNSSTVEHAREVRAELASELDKLHGRSRPSGG